MRPTQPLMRRIRRLALTTKTAGRGFYKGTGSGAMGTHTKHGAYRLNYDKVRTYEVPELEGFKLTPFVSRKVKAPEGKYAPGEGPLSGINYLNNWQQHGAGL